jgi:hypothetical protein
MIYKFFHACAVISLLFVLSCSDDETVQTELQLGATGEWTGTLNGTSIGLSITEISKDSLQGRVIIGAQPAVPETLEISSGKRISGDSIYFEIFERMCWYKFGGRLFADERIEGTCYYRCINDFPITRVWSVRKSCKPDGQYSYTSYDTTGEPIVKGWFTISFVDSVRVTGEWHFRAIGNPEHIGPQIGDDSLQGEYRKTDLWIGLNPRYVDNNIFLSGIMYGKQINGTWTYSTIAGPVNGGSFVAIKQ